MLTPFEQSIISLRKTRIELNDALLEFGKEQKELHTAITERVFTSESRFYGYNKTIDLINRTKKDREFLEYQRLSKLSEKLDYTGNVIKLKGKDLRKYQELSQRFINYRVAITSLDVVAVKRRCAEEIARVKSSSEILMTKVTAYKVLRSKVCSELLAIAIDANCTQEKPGQMLSLLDLYASIDIAVLSGEGGMPRYAISQRLATLLNVKATKVLEEGNLMEILKADCIHEMNAIYLKKEQNIELGPFTAKVIPVYRCQKTSMTKVQTVDSVKSAGQLIENATINYQILTNLVTIKRKKSNMQGMADAATSQLTRILADNLGKDAAQVNEIYALPVNKSGERVADKMMREEIHNNIAMLQMDNAKQFQYIPKREVLYSENESDIVDWFESEDVNFDNDIAEFELLA